MLTDRYGLPLSTTSTAARDDYVLATDRALTFYPGAAEAYDRAIAVDPGFALAHGGKAQVLMRQGNVEAAQATMDEAEAIIRPLVEALPGYQGMTELASADGKFISITLFDSEESAKAAEPVFDQEMPAKLGHIFRQWEGARRSVDVFTVVGEDRG